MALKGWIAVFRTGTHTDAGGLTRSWTRADLDQIVANYQPAQHEAPVVIGHPQTDDPAWAWVEALRRTGDILYAKFKDVVPEFGEMVRRGLFKKRSIALFPSPEGKWSLRHIGFLGAVPPAVKGLDDRPAFTSEASPHGQILLEFAAMDDQDRSLLARIMTSLREWIIDRSGLEEADRVLPLWDIQALSNPPPPADAPTMGEHSRLPLEIDMDRQELERRIQAAHDEGRHAAAQAFAEQQQAMQARLLELEALSRQQRIGSFLADLKRQGKLLPAWERAGIATFMESLEQAAWPQTLTIAFSEDRAPLDPAAWFQAFLQSLPEAVIYQEWAAHNATTNNDPGEHLTELTKQYLAQHAGTTYTDAFAAVQRLHPDLAAEYLANQRTQTRLLRD